MDSFDLNVWLLWSLAPPVLENLFDTVYISKRREMSKKFACQKLEIHADLARLSLSVTSRGNEPVHAQCSQSPVDLGGM